MGQDDVAKLSDTEIEQRLKTSGWGSPHFAALIAERQQRLASGEATYKALITAVKALIAKAPPECDVLIEAFGILVQDVKFIQPHTFIFLGCDEEGNATCAVVHFSQVITKVVFRPKTGAERVITGFSKA